MEMKKTLCFAWGMVAVASLFADGVAVTNSFEDASAGAFLGDAVVSDGTPPRPAVVDYPLPSADHYKILEISGTTSNNLNLTSADTAQMDMMVRISRPEDPLEDISAAGSLAQFAVGIESNGALCVWGRRKNADAASWMPVSSSNYVDGTWVRLSLNFDYTTGKCQMLVDGQSVISEHGYLTAAGNTAGNGSWYTLARPPAENKSISAVCIAGSAGLDDFVAQSGIQAAGEEAFPVADDVVVVKSLKQRTFAPIGASLPRAQGFQYANNIPHRRGRACPSR